MTTHWKLAGKSLLASLLAFIYILLTFSSCMQTTSLAEKKMWSDRHRPSSITETVNLSICKFLSPKENLLEHGRHCPSPWSLMHILLECNTVNHGTLRFLDKGYKPVPSLNPTAAAKVLRLHFGEIQQRGGVQGLQPPGQRQSLDPKRLFRAGTIHR